MTLGERLRRMRRAVGRRLKASPTRVWDGYIDTFSARLYDRELSAEEIARIAQGEGSCEKCNQESHGHRLCNRCWAERVRDYEHAPTPSHPMCGLIRPDGSTGPTWYLDGRRMDEPELQSVQCRDCHTMRDPECPELGEWHVWGEDDTYWLCEEHRAPRSNWLEYGTLD
jgi:hypothetical protein